MYKITEYLEEIDALRRSKKGHLPAQKELWIIEYKLMALGYNKVSEEAQILCTEQDLQKPTESLDSLLKRYEEIKNGDETLNQTTNVDSYRHPLKNFLNLNNHLTVVLIQGKLVKLPAYKKTPRVEYAYVEHPKFKEFGKIAIAMEIKNLPVPMRNLNLVISREALRAIREIENRLLKKKWRGESMEEWLFNNDLKIRPKIRFITIENMATRWPALKEWFDKHIPADQQREYLLNLRRYVGRNDLWSPGPRIRNKAGEVIACDGLIQIKN